MDATSNVKPYDYLQWQQTASSANSQPVDPILARLGKLADEINSMALANLASVHKAADNLTGSIPCADGTPKDNQPTLGEGRLVALERSLEAALGIVNSTASALSRIERLF
jgi:hypothetical protein